MSSGPVGGDAMTFLAALERFSFSAASRVEASFSSATRASALPVVLAPLSDWAWVVLPMLKAPSVNWMVSMRQRQGGRDVVREG